MGKPNPLVQYIVLRTDLMTRLGWTVGAVIAQACHATTASALQYRDDEEAKQYYNDVNNMHKIVLGISSETKLRNLSKRLSDFYVEHRVWTEQPEDTPTCLVTKPAPKADKADFFRKLQLFRMPSDKSKKKDIEDKSENNDSRLGARGGDASHRQVQHYQGAGHMPNIVDNGGNDNRSKKRNGSGKNDKKKHQAECGHEERDGSSDRPRSFMKKSHEDVGDEERVGSGDGRPSPIRKDRDDGFDGERSGRRKDHRSSKKKNHDDGGDEERSGSGDNRRSSKKKNFDDVFDEDRSGSGDVHQSFRENRDAHDGDEKRNDSGREQRGHESTKDNSNHSREDRRKEREKNGGNYLDDTVDRMSSSPKLPPINKVNDLI